MLTGTGYSTKQTITSGTIKHQNSFLSKMQTILTRGIKKEDVKEKKNDSGSPKHVKTEAEKKKEEAQQFFR